MTMLLDERRTGRERVATYFPVFPIQINGKRYWLNTVKAVRREYGGYEIDPGGGGVYTTEWRTDKVLTANSYGMLRSLVLFLSRWLFAIVSSLLSLWVFISGDSWVFAVCVLCSIFSFFVGICVSDEMYNKDSFGYE